MKEVNLLPRKKQKFSRSLRKEENGVSKTININEVENGYVVAVEKSWQDEKKGYQYEEKKYVFTENPIDLVKKMGDKKNSFMEQLKEMDTLEDYFADFFNAGGGKVI